MLRGRAQTDTDRTQGEAKLAMQHNNILTYSPIFGEPLIKLCIYIGNVRDRY